jgi:hypothetical protein
MAVVEKVVLHELRIAAEVLQKLSRLAIRTAGVC